MRGVSCLCGCLEKPPPPPSGALPPSKLPPLQEALVKSDLCFLPQLLPGSLSSGKRGSPGGCGSSPEALPNPPTLMGAATVDAGGSRAHVAPRGPPSPWSQAGAWGHFPRGAPPQEHQPSAGPSLQCCPCGSLPPYSELRPGQTRHGNTTHQAQGGGDDPQPQESGSDGGDKPSLQSDGGNRKPSHRGLQQQKAGVKAKGKQL